MHDLLDQPARDFDWGPKSQRWIPRRDGDKRDVLAALWPLAAVAIGAALLAVGLALALASADTSEAGLRIEPPPKFQSASVVVHVTGMVVRPGVVLVAPGARAADAVDAAGGELRGADLAQINLATPVVDGMQLYVPPTQAETE